jgi:lysophospholipase L1-like esterase
MKAKLRNVMLFMLTAFIGSGSCFSYGQATDQEKQNKDNMFTLNRRQIDSVKKITAEKVNSDWAFLKKYEDENEKLPPVAPGEKRVVFMGNSITEAWKILDKDFFAKHESFVGRGISGQTTPQMLIRFRDDVINLHPAAVVILAGTNDIAGNTGPTTLERIFGNIVSMIQLARANDIAVVLCSVLPAYDYPWRPGLQPAEKIIKLNSLLQSYAEKNKIVYVDFFTPMADKRNGLKAEYSKDGVHPTLEGYKVMDELVVKGIEKAIAGSTK